MCPTVSHGFSKIGIMHYCGNKIGEKGLLSIEISMVRFKICFFPATGCLSKCLCQRSTLKLATPVSFPIFVFIFKVILN